MARLRDALPTAIKRLQDAINEVTVGTSFTLEDHLNREGQLENIAEVTESTVIQEEGEPIITIKTQNERLFSEKER